MRSQHLLLRTVRYALALALGIVLSAHPAAAASISWATALKLVSCGATTGALVVPTGKTGAIGDCFVVFAKGCGSVGVFTTPPANAGGMTWTNLVNATGGTSNAILGTMSSAQAAATSYTFTNTGDIAEEILFDLAGSNCTTDFASGAGGAGAVTTFNQSGTLAFQDFVFSLFSYQGTVSALSYPTNFSALFTSDGNFAGSGYADPTTGATGTLTTSWTTSSNLDQVLIGLEPAAISLLHQTTGSVSAASTLTVTIPSTTAGNFLAVLGSINNSSGSTEITGVTDNGGVHATWTNFFQNYNTDASAARYTTLWHALSVPAGITQVTLTAGDATHNIAAIVVEFDSNGSYISASDQNQHNSSGATTSTAVTTAATSALGQASELCIALESNSGNANPTAGPTGGFAPFTGLATSPSIAGAYLTTVATTAQSTGWTVGNTGWAAGIGCYKITPIALSAARPVRSDGLSLFRP